jgi:LCP family protein required for cell wall assembly
VPGWGQWAAGRRRRGSLLAGLAALALLVPPAALLSVTHPFLPLPPLPTPGGVRDGLAALGAALAAGATGAALAGPAGGLVETADWSTLASLVLGLNVAALVLRALVAMDAAVAARAAGRPASGESRPAARGRGTRRLASAALGGVAVALVAGPHLAVAGAAAAARPLFVQLLPPVAPFADGPDGGARPGDPGPGQPVPGPPEPAAADPFASALEGLRPEGDGAGRPVWDGTSPLNVLLLGTDRRPGEAAVQRWGNSDTIILVSVDPARGRVAMVSVPRDVLVPVPGAGEQKVNAAYLRGGPPLAVRVVGDLLGLPVHRWASVDTSAFEAVVDAIGGVVVDVERPLRDDDYPTEDYGVRRIRIAAGLQWLDGERALWFARSRHEANDYDRAGRQQRLLRALQGRARDPSLLPRVPALLGVVAGAVQTDASPREVVALARLAAGAAGGTGGAGIDLRAVRGLVLAPPEYGRELVRPDLYAVVPDRARIRQSVAALMADATADATPETAEGEWEGETPSPASPAVGAPAALPLP